MKKNGQNKKCLQIFKKRIYSLFSYIQIHTQISAIYFTIFVLLEFISLLTYASLPYITLTHYTSLHFAFKALIDIFYIAHANLIVQTILTTLINIVIIAYFTICLATLKKIKKQEKIMKWMLLVLWMLVYLRCTFFLFEYDSLHFVKKNNDYLNPNAATITYAKMHTVTFGSIAYITLISLNSLSQILLHLVEALMFLFQGISYEHKSTPRSMNGINYMVFITIFKIYFGLLVCLNIHPDSDFIVWATIPMCMVFLLDLMTLMLSPATEFYLQSLYSLLRTIIFVLYIDMHIIKFLKIHNMIGPLIFGIFFVIPGKVYLAYWYQTRFSMEPISSFREAVEYLKLNKKLMGLALEVDDVHSVAKIYEIYETNKPYLSLYLNEEDNSDTVIKCLGIDKEFKLTDKKAKNLARIFDDDERNQLISRPEACHLEPLFCVIEEIFNLARAKFNKSCELKILEAQFELDWRNNPFTCLRHLYNAESCSPSIRQKCKIVFLRSKLEKILLEAYQICNESRQKQDDILKLYSYQIHYNEWMELVDSCSIFIYEFWCALAKEKIDNRELDRLAKEIHFYKKIIDEKAKSILRDRELDLDFLAKYYTFTKEVFHNELQAADILRQYINYLD